MVAAGLGVSLVPAYIASLTTPGVIFKRVRSNHWTAIDIGMKAKPENPVTEAFLDIARKQFSKTGRSAVSTQPRPNGITGE